MSDPLSSLPVLKQEPTPGYQPIDLLELLISGEGSIRFEKAGRPGAEVILFNVSLNVNGQRVGYSQAMSGKHLERSVHARNMILAEVERALHEIDGYQKIIPKKKKG